MTAPFPTHKQEEWRYADLDALRPVWQQFAEPLTLTVGPGETFEKVWLPGDDEVLLRRVQIATRCTSACRTFSSRCALVFCKLALNFMTKFRWCASILLRRSSLAPRTS